MPSKDQLRGQVAASLNAPINAIAQVLAAPMRDLAGVVNSLNDQPRKLASLLQAVADQKSGT
jgi:ribosomal protein L10